MNIDNINTAISIMERAGKINMATFQETNAERDYSVYTTEKELHNCGTAACFAGWVAVSPEWHNFGGIVDEGGEPVIPGFNNIGYSCIAKWLDIHDELAKFLMQLNTDMLHYCLHTNNNGSEFHSYAFYNVSDISEITKEHVISELENLKEVGELNFVQNKLDNLKSLIKNIKTNIPQINYVIYEHIEAKYMLIINKFK